METKGTDPSNIQGKRRTQHNKIPGDILEANLFSYVVYKGECSRKDKQC